MQIIIKGIIARESIYPAALVLCFLITALMCPQSARSERFVLPQSGQFLSFHPQDDGAMQLGFPLPKPRFIYNVQPQYDTGGYGEHCMKKDEQGNPVIEQGIAGNGICDGPEICDGTVTDNLPGLIMAHTDTCLLLSTIHSDCRFCGIFSHSTTAHMRRIRI